MIVLEFTEDKFGKAMKAISKITEHAECLADIFEELSEPEEESAYGSRRHYDRGNSYGTSYSGYRGGRYSYAK